jgi:DNA-binding NarL/FixJ family response regulator
MRSGAVWSSPEAAADSSAAPEAIRVLVVDDHAAVRAGLRALIGLEPDLQPVAAAGNCAEALEAAAIVAPDVAVVDYHLEDGDGIELCRGLRAMKRPPEVVIYSAFADTRLVLPAVLVGARAVLDKAEAGEQLFRAVRVAAARSEELKVGPGVLRAAAEAIPLDDLPILGMLADHTPANQIAHVLGMSEADVAARAMAIVERLKRGIPTG